MDDNFFIEFLNGNFKYPNNPLLNELRKELIAQDDRIEEKKINPAIIQVENKANTRINRLIAELNQEETLEIVKDKNIIRKKKKGKILKIYRLYLPDDKNVTGLKSGNYISSSYNPESEQTTTIVKKVGRKKSEHPLESIEYDLNLNPDIDKLPFISLKIGSSLFENVKEIPDKNLYIVYSKYKGKYLNPWLIIDKKRQKIIKRLF